MKERIVRVTAAITVLLVFCTITGSLIEKKMRIKVQTVPVIVSQKQGEEGMARTDQECLTRNENGQQGIYLVEDQEGIWGKEEAVTFVALDHLLIGKEEGKIKIQGLSGKKAVKASTQLLKDKDQVEALDEKVLPETEEDKDQIRKQLVFQIPRIFLAAGIFPVLLVIFWKGCKKIGWENNRKGKKEKIKGGAMIIFGMLLWYFAFGAIEIPNQYLPRQFFFDLPFYGEEIRGFYQYAKNPLNGEKAVQLLTMGKHMIVVCSKAVAVFWGIFLYWCLRGKEPFKKIKRKDSG